jgi:sirohydrochlorin cobaltochelatase
VAVEKAVILFGHGSRDPGWRKAIDAVASALQARAPDVQVRCAFLELSAPDLASAAGELAALGASGITVVPLFLGSGRHVREDLPGLVEQLRRQHPGIALRLQQPVGEDARVTDLLAKIALE